MIKCSEMLISPGIPIFVDYLDRFQQIFVSIYICDNNVPTSRVSTNYVSMKIYNMNIIFLQGTKIGIHKF